MFSDKSRNLCIRREHQDSIIEGHLHSKPRNFVVDSGNKDEGYEHLQGIREFAFQSSGKPA